MIKICFCLYWEIKKKSQLIISTKRQSTNHRFQVDSNFSVLRRQRATRSTYTMTTGVLVWAIIFGWSLFASETRRSIYMYIYPESFIASDSFRPVSRFHNPNFTLEFPSNIQISPPAKSFFDLRRDLTHHPANTFESAGIRRPYVDHCDESRRYKPEFYSRRGILGESVDTHGET